MKSVIWKLYLMIEIEIQQFLYEFKNILLIKSKLLQSAFITIRTLVTSQFIKNIEVHLTF